MLTVTTKDGTIEFEPWLRNVDERFFHPGPLTIYASREFFYVNSQYDPERRKKAFGLPTFLVEVDGFMLTMEPLAWEGNGLLKLIESLNLPKTESWVEKRIRESAWKG